MSTTCTFNHEAVFHEALSHEAVFHEAVFQDAVFQDAVFQDASTHDALFHEALFRAAFTQRTIVFFGAAFVTMTFNFHCVGRVGLKIVGHSPDFGFFAGLHD